MTRTKITTTNDASVPRVASFANGVTWYAYVRDTDAGLYLQREINGQRGPEIFVVRPVRWLEIIEDAVLNKAFIYFVNDECLLRIEVTSSLESPTVQAYTRSATWYDVASGASSTGSSLRYSAPLLDPPTLTLVPGILPSQRTIVVKAPTATLVQNRLLRSFVLYRDEGPGVQVFGVFPISLSGQVVVTVPATATPQTKWYATCLRDQPGQEGESAGSNVEIDNGDVRADALVAAVGTGTSVAWAPVDKAPVKRNAGTDSTPASVGTGTPTWALADKAPVKRSAGTDPLSGAIGTGTDVSWSVNGTEVINP